MKIVLLYIESAKEKWVEEGSIHLSKRISGFMPFEEIVLKSSRRSGTDGQLKRQEESDTLLKQLKSDDYVVLFDETGDAPNSRAFSKQLSSWLNGGKKRIVFVIGGAFGASDELKSRAQKKISLSPMTLNHHLARLVALEQIYRGFAILNNHPYHND